MAVSSGAHLAIVGSTAVVRRAHLTVVSMAIGIAIGIAVGMAVGMAIGIAVGMAIVRAATHLAPLLG